MSNKMHSHSVQRPGSGDGEPGSDKRYKVLVVDDDPAFLSSMEALLMDHVDVVASPSPERARQVIAAQRFDLVCSDFKMPGMSGMDFLKHVESQPYFISTLLITGNDQYIRDKPASQRHYVLLKPFAPDRFIGLVLQLAQLARMKRGVQSLNRAVGPAEGQETSSPPSSMPRSNLESPISTHRRR